MLRGTNVICQKGIALLGVARKVVPISEGRLMKKTHVKKDLWNRLNGGQGQSKQPQSSKCLAKRTDGRTIRKHNVPSVNYLTWQE